MEETLPTGNARRSRFWLYTPITLLLLVAVAWSVAWFLIRNRAEEAINAWLATEARTGREWTCQNRQIGGYPFRIEVTCDALGLKQGRSTSRSDAPRPSPRSTSRASWSPISTDHFASVTEPRRCRAAGA